MGRNAAMGGRRRTAIGGTRTLLASAVLAAVAVTGCSNSTETVGAADPTVTSTVPEVATAATISADDLRAFRDAAAAAPYWYTVDWTPPFSVPWAARDATAAFIGTVDTASVDAPRPDPLTPYEGAPTFLNLEVILDVKVTRVVVGQVANDRIAVRIPVSSGTPEALADAQVFAHRIHATAPSTAVGVFVISATSGAATPVAFESTAGELVGFYAPMDEVVAPLNVDALADALASAIAG